MQKGKNAQYVAAGLQAAPGMHIHVRSSVHLPDSEAGQPRDPDREPFQAGYVQPAPRESVTVPLRGALIFLCALFFVFGCLTVAKAAKRAELRKKIDTMIGEIQKTENENIEFAAQLDEARDPTRISDMACQKLHMIAPTSANTLYVTAPDTRPFEIKTPVQADSSPNAALDGLITGSR